MSEYTSRSGFDFSSLPASFSKYFSCGSFSRTLMGSTTFCDGTKADGLNSALILNSSFLWLLSEGVNVDGRKAGYVGVNSAELDGLKSGNGLAPALKLLLGING